MRKYLVTLTALTLMCFTNVVAYAGPLSAASAVPVEEAVVLPAVVFDVSSGIKSFDKTESTFDESRTISGSSEQGAVIAISVSTKNADGNLKVNSAYNIEVGASGLFSQTIELAVGENVVKISVCKDGCSAVDEEATIKRKKREIKNELENGISIPGDSSFTIKSSSFTISNPIK